MKFIVCSLVLLTIQISLASELSPYSESNPYSDTCHARLLIMAEHHNVAPEVIDHYKKFIVTPDAIESIQKVSTLIQGQEPYTAMLKDGNQIEATYYHSGPSKGRASVYATYHKPDMLVSLDLPIDLKNFSILKCLYLAQQNHD